MHRWVIVAIVGMAGVAGCRSDFVQPPDAAPPDVAPQGPAPFVSGSRLRVKWLELGNGARAFESWRDTQLGIDCRFQHSPDGAWRCLPEDAGLVFYYSDSSCTAPLLSLYCHHGDYAVTYDETGDACAVDAPLGAVWKLGGEYQGAVWLLENGRCVSTNPTDGPFFHADQVDSAGFAAATPHPVDVGDRLTATRFDGEDGSSQRIWQYAAHLVDRRRNAPCDVADEDVFGLANPVCMPAPASVVFPGDGTYYSDAACSHAVLRDTPNCPRADAVLVPDDAHGCTYTVRTRGAPLGSDTVYVDSTGTCEAWQPGDTSDFYQFGPPAGPDVVAPLVATPGDSGPRIQRIDLRTPGGDLLAESQNLQDKQSNAECSLARFPDGDLRCLPLRAIRLEKGAAWFSDAACTREVGLYNSCDAPLVAERVSSLCDDVSEVLAVGARLPVATTVYRIDPLTARCSEQPAAGLAFYALGAPIDRSAFPSLTERIE